MERSIWITVSLLVALVVTSACFPFGYVVRGSGRLTSETRQVSSFDRIEVHDGGNLYLQQGDKESLEIEAEENLMRYIDSRVINGKLILEFEPALRGPIFTTRPINYYVTMKDISGIAVSGGGDIEAEKIETASLDINVSGGGDIEIEDLFAKVLNVGVSGGGSLDISGEVTDQRVEISGGGDYRAGDLLSQTARVRVSGGGDATLWAKDQLDVDVSGGGDVYYYGDPAITEDISGGGDVHSRGDK